MDRMEDSGSFDMGSNPVGVTKSLVEQRFTRLLNYCVLNCLI